MPSLDTNVLLRIILRDNEQLLASAKRLLTRHETFAVADVALIELEYVLTGYYEYSRQEFADIVQTLLLNNQHIYCSREAFERTLPQYIKHPTESFADCYLAATAVLHKQIPLYTFDKKMARDLPHVELVS